MECEEMVRLSDLTVNERDIIRQMYRSLHLALSDLAWATARGKEEVLRHTRGVEELASYLRETFPEKGVVFASAHLGNWELCGQVLSSSVAPMLSVFKAHKKEWINELYRQIRNRSGQQIVEKAGALTPLFKHIRRGGIAGLLVDQHGGEDGTPSRFLGRPAKSWDSAVRLAFRAKCPLVPVALIRESLKGSPAFRLEWRPALKLPLDENEKLLEQQAVETLDNALSDLVRIAPEQWMWLGRKWGRTLGTSCLSSSLRFRW